MGGDLGAQLAREQEHQHTDPEGSSEKQGGTGGHRAPGRVYSSVGIPRSTLAALPSGSAAGS